jgi:serine aminopeptidase S33 family
VKERDKERDNDALLRWPTRPRLPRQLAAGRTGALRRRHTPRHGEHLGLYDALARRLVADGHAVHAMDAVGHGRGDGERAVIASWDYYVDDALGLVGLVGLVAARHPTTSTPRCTTR